MGGRFVPSPELVEKGVVSRSSNRSKATNFKIPKRRYQYNKLSQHNNELIPMDVSTDLMSTTMTNGESHQNQGILPNNLGSQLFTQCCIILS